ncbi:hypothetical protein [Duganella aceris]|uniref:hypothetical protein n=1 Tax=Duganella aceris TaxID=2703883 RepID=UPI001E384BA8|nr:hypothetical protein [Duganella aceris]
MAASALRADAQPSRAALPTLCHALSLGEYRDQFTDRDQAMACAYFSTLYTMAEIGEFFGVSLRSVNRAVRKFEENS